MIDTDLSEYNELNRKFNGSFSFFNYVFEDAMSCATNAVFRNKYAKKMGTGEQVACRHLGDKRTEAELLPAEPWKDGGAKVENGVVRMAELHM